jgi:hypothetical protein
VGQTLDLTIPTAEWALPLTEPARYKGAVGGRSRGASHFFAGLAVEEMVCDPDLRFVCIREIQRALRYSAKSLVESKIREMGVGHLFDILTTEIRRKGGTGVMIFEGMQDHTADSLKSLEGFTRAWVEEAHTLSEKSLRLLRPTIRGSEDGPPTEMWFSWNRESPEDPVDEFFRKRQDQSNVVLCEATYLDNPFLPPEMMQEAEDDRLADPDIYEHVWGGGYFLGGSGRVYKKFLNKPYPIGNVDESVEDLGGELLVGMDFNVNPMTAVVGCRAVDEYHVLDALEIQTSDTGEMCEELASRYPDRTVIVCPDPAGKARHTSAQGTTDFSIIKSFGFRVRAPNAAPLVRDRENNSNEMYCTGSGETERRRVRIHPRARALITALANLTYKDGTSQRDKNSRYDHICEAIDRCLFEEFNVLTKRSVGTFEMSVY